MAWGAFYGLLTLGAFLLVLQGRRHDRRRSEDTLGAVLVLAALWVLTNAAHMWVPKPYNQFFPAMDAITSGCLAWIWRRRLRPWKIVMILALVLDGVLHVAYFQTGDTSHATRYRYDLALNLIYVGQLLASASVGIWAIAVRWGLRRPPIR